MNQACDQIEQMIERCERAAFSKNDQIAAATFQTIRQLVVSEVEPSLLANEIRRQRDAFAKEAQSYNEKLQSISSQTNDYRKIIILSDSLALPRPADMNRDNGNESYPYRLQEVMVHSGIAVRSWGERYMTTRRLIENWDEIAYELGGFDAAHILFHIGLNDYVERIFMEEERIALQYLPEALRERIIRFVQKYRNLILTYQEDYAYVPFDEFSSYLTEIIQRLQREGAASITLVTQIAVPMHRWEYTAGYMFKQTRMNHLLYDKARAYGLNVFDLDRLMWQENFKEVMEPDMMHLNREGHRLFANALKNYFTPIIRESKMSNIYIYSTSQRAHSAKTILENYYTFAGFVQIPAMDTGVITIAEVLESDFETIFLPNETFEADRKILIDAGVPDEKISIHFRYATTGYLDQRKLLFGKTAPLIFDIGANEGQTIFRYKNILRDATIFAFEPNPDMIEPLKQESMRHRGVEMFQMAMGAECGTLEFFKNPQSLYSSTLPMSHAFDHQLYSEGKQCLDTESISVAVSTVDTFCKEHQIEHIDILKIDVEGAELSVLKGARNMLEQQQIDLIYAETYFQEKYTGQSLMYDVGRYLYDCGYVMFSMYHFVKKKDLPMLFCDTVFISPAVLKRLENERAQTK